MKSMLTTLALAFGLGLLTPARAAEVDRYIANVLTTKHVPGAAIAVIKDGRVVKTVVYGRSNLQLESAVSSRSRFQIASITKLFTGVTLAILAQEKKLSLEDPVGAYMPSLPPAWRGVTLRQLAAHISGLPDAFEQSSGAVSDAELARTREQALAAAEAKAVRAPPGTTFAYDQVSYMLLSAVIEKVTGQPFESAVKTAVLDPAGMADTQWADARQLVTGRVDMYSTVGHPDLQNAFLFVYPSYGAAAGGLNTDVRDFAQFAVALETGGLLTSAAMSDAWRPTRYASGEVANIAPMLHLTGTLTPDIGGFLAYGADGAHPRQWMDGGSAATFMYFPQDHVAVVVLTNLQGAPTTSMAEKIASFYIPGLTLMFSH